MSKSKPQSESPGRQPAEPSGADTELLQRLAALEDSTRRSTEFLGSIAHELRNPLAPIRNSLHILKLGCSSDEGVQESIDIIERQLHVLIRLIDDIHDVSRIARGNLRLHKEKVSLSEVIEAAVAASRTELATAEQKLTLELPAGPIYVEADAIRLEQVFARLLHNAAKFSEPGGEVTIRAERGAGEVVVRIRDTGIGIDADMLDKIFNLFQKSRDERSRGRGGLGIGLSISRDIVQLHGGAITAKSQGAGQGSEFLVSLPVKSR